MNILVAVENVAAVLELIFFVLTMYALVTGLRTKDYNNLKRYGIMYLLLNILRKIYTFAMQKGATVSVIGGADGPTSIFLAGKVGGFSSIIYLLSLVIILIGVIILFYMKKKK